MFGFGSRKIVSGQHKTTGMVTFVKKCWWIKVNTKPVRLHPLDGAIFPHVIHFLYHVNGAEYKGSKFISCYSPCPHAGAKITIYYDKDKPQKYAVEI